jgi:Skp family chaperone for outer membrane proteins
MRYTTGAFLFVTALLTACDMNNSGRVAVIDLDEVASVIGRDKVIAESVQSFAKEQEAKLTLLRDELRINIEQEQNKLGEKPAESEQVRLNQLAQSSEIKLRQEIAKVEEAAGQLRINLVLEFKKEVEPIARRVATQRGMSLVMIKQNAMLYISPDSDITNDVIDALQKRSNLNDKTISRKIEAEPAESK